MKLGVKHGLPHELHMAGRICDILYTPNNQNLRGVTPILADVSLTHTCIGNAVDRDQWGTYQGKKLSQRAKFKSLKHPWAENVHVVVPFVSDTLGSVSGESAETLCLFAWQSARRSSSQKTGGMVLGQTTALVCWWRRRRVLFSDGMRA